MLSPSKIFSYLITVAGVLAIIFLQTKFNPFATDISVGREISFAEFSKMKSEQESEGKRVAIKAFIRLSGNLHQNVLVGHRENALKLVSAWDSPHVLWIHLPLNQNGKDAFYVPANYKEDEAIFYDHEGKPFSFHTKFLVSVTFERVKEAEPPQDPQTGEFVWRFLDVRLDAALD